MKNRISLLMISTLFTALSAGATDGFKIQVTEPSQLNLNLGDQASITMTMVAPENFSGMVKLVLDRKELDSLAGGGADIQITTPPSLIIREGDANIQFNVKFNVTPMSPSFGDFRNIKVNALLENGEMAAQATASLRVNAILEVKLFGGGMAPEKWSVDPLKTIPLRSHAGGVLLRFFNYDTKQTHLIHGNSPIQHARTPMDKAPEEGKAGGVYETRVDVKTKQSGSFYCHNHEGPGNAKTVVFNSDL